MLTAQPALAGATELRADLTPNSPQLHGTGAPGVHSGASARSLVAQNLFALVAVGAVVVASVGHCIAATGSGGCCTKAAVCTAGGSVRGGGAVVTRAAHDPGGGAFTATTAGVAYTGGAVATAGFVLELGGAKYAGGGLDTASAE